MTACLKPFRPVGSVCDEHPGSLTHFNGIPFLVVPLGFTYAVYKGVELRAIRGGPTFEHRVVAVVAHGKLRVVAEGPNIHCLAHNKQLWSAVHAPVLRSNVTKLIVRDNILFSYGEDRVVSTWSLRRGHRIFAMTLGGLQQQGGAASVTSWCVPAEYNNKLLVGTSNGELQLYNFSRPAEVSNEDVASGIPVEVAPLFRKNFFVAHTKGKNDAFLQLLRNNNNNNAAGFGSISALATSAVKDVVAVATSTGRVMLYDFGHDDIITEFRHSATMAPRQLHAGAAASTVGANSPGSLVTALAFRQESANNNAMLVSAAADGSVAVWDLEERLLHGMLSATKQRNTEQALSTPAHHATVHTLSFFNQTALTSHTKASVDEAAATNAASAHPPGALLVTAGADNSLQQWSFHTVDGAAIRVRNRSGHRGPCTTATFYGPDMIVSAAGEEDGSLRVTHLFSDRASWEMSQGAGIERAAAAQRRNRSELLLAPCREIVTAPIRNHQWSSVLTRHDTCAKVAGWAFDSRKLAFVCEPIRTVSQSVSSMAVSLCGSYVVLGYTSGHVVRVTIQDESLLHFVYLTAGGAGIDSSSSSSSSSFAEEAMLMAADSGQDPDALLPPARAQDARALPAAHNGGGAVSACIVAFENEIVVTCGPATYFVRQPQQQTMRRVTSPVLMFWSLRDGKLLGWSRNGVSDSPAHMFREIGHLSNNSGSTSGTKSAASTLLCAASADHSLRVYSVPHPDASWYSALPLESRPVVDDASNNRDQRNTASSAATHTRAAVAAAKEMAESRVVSERVHLARCFVGHRAHITAVAVSPDTRKHIFSADAAGGVAVWDVAAATCIGLFRAYAPVTSLAFDPDGAFLLSTHAGDRCPQLWSCLLRYGMVCSPIDAAAPDAWEKNAVPMIGMRHREDQVTTGSGVDGSETKPSSTNKKKKRKTAKGSNKNDDGEEDDAAEEDEDDGDAAKSSKMPELFSSEKDIALRAREVEMRRKEALMSIPVAGWSLSSQHQTRKRRRQLLLDSNPAAALDGQQEQQLQVADTVNIGVDDWLSMPRLDAIYQKNEPLLPPKKVAAPFFLPQTKELHPTFIVQETTAATVQQQNEASREAASRRSKKSNVGGKRIGLAAVLDQFVEHVEAAKRNKTQKRTGAGGGAGASLITAAAASSSSSSSSSLVDFMERSVAQLVNSPGGVAALDADILLLTAPVAANDISGRNGNIRAVLHLLRFCAVAVRCGNAVDFVQALLATCLKHHGHLIIGDPDEEAALEDYFAEREAQKKNKEKKGDDAAAHYDDDDDDDNDGDDGIAKNAAERKLLRESLAMRQEVRDTIMLLRTAQREATSKMEAMCGSTMCFASTFANAYG